MQTSLKGIGMKVSDSMWNSQGGPWHRRLTRSEEGSNWGWWIWHQSSQSQRQSPHSEVLVVQNLQPWSLWTVDTGAGTMVITGDEEIRACERDRVTTSAWVGYPTFASHWESFYLIWKHRAIDDIATIGRARLPALLPLLPQPHPCPLVPPYPHLHPPPSEQVCAELFSTKHGLPTKRIERVHCKGLSADGKPCTVVVELFSFKDRVAILKKCKVPGIFILVMFTILQRCQKFHSFPFPSRNHLF